jgi:CDP-diacylglycerol--glycerol-3-phosphate 3-phosphatidyltransferase
MELYGTAGARAAAWRLRLSRMRDRHRRSNHARMTDVPTRARFWRHVPNVLSATRIALAPLMLLCAVTGLERAFTGLLVPALLTDAADGWLARGLGVQSKLGARLDSLGDSLVWYAGLAGLIAFQREVLAAHAVLFGAVIACWLLESVLAWLRYRRLSSFHTRLSKLAGVLLSVYVVTLFVWGHSLPLLVIAAAVSILASLEEMVLLALLPQWRSDVPGVYWLRRVLRSKKTSSPV